MTSDASPQPGVALARQQRRGYTLGPEWVYVIGPKVGPQKIGIANNPTQRCAEFQTGHPETLVVSHKVEVAQHEALQIEKFAHRLLHARRARGGWFNVTPVEAAEAVNDAIAYVRRVKLNPASFGQAGP